MSTILLIVLILLLIGALPTWPYSADWGYYPTGGLGLLVLIGRVSRPQVNSMRLASLSNDARRASEQEWPHHPVSRQSHCRVNFRPIMSGMESVFQTQAD